MSGTAGADVTGMVMAGGAAGVAAGRVGKAPVAACTDMSGRPEGSCGPAAATGFDGDIEVRFAADRAGSAGAGAAGSNTDPTGAFVRLGGG